MTGVSSLPKARNSIDMILLWSVLALLVAGIVSVFDSSFGQSAIHGGTGVVFLKKQLIAGGVGFVGFFVVLKMGYQRLRNWSSALLALSILMLIACYLPKIGIKLNGARRWIGPGIQFQPSEFANLSLVIYLSALLASYIEKRRFDITNFFDGLLPPLAIVGLITILIEREPDLGTSIVVFLTSITIFYVAGAQKRHIGAILVTGAIMVALVCLVGFRTNRIKTWLDPFTDMRGAGFQQVHSRVAVATGSVTGVGFGKGREKYYLPEQNTDFIFATIAEETGLVGSSIIIGLFFLIAWRATEIARQSKDIFGSLLASGIGAMISWQALINLAVVTGSIPATGVPLPFISFGGTSLAILLVSCGALLSISHVTGQENPRYAELEPALPRLRTE